MRVLRGRARSALIRHGPEHAAVLLDGLSEWIVRQGIQLGRRGARAVPAGTDEAAFERAGYVSAMRAANRAHARGD
jgi:dihydroorotate dehydrogenase (fumarate)